MLSKLNLLLFKLDTMYKENLQTAFNFLLFADQILCTDEEIDQKKSNLEETSSEINCEKTDNERHRSESENKNFESNDNLKSLISRGKLLSLNNKIQTGYRDRSNSIKNQRLTRNSKSYTCIKKPIFCEDCKITFTSQTRYDKHKERNGGQCVFVCEYCDKVFLYRKSRYDLHIRSAHTKERPFTCDVCGKGYVTSDKLKIHKRLHTGMKEENGSFNLPYPFPNFYPLIYI